MRNRKVKYLYQLVCTSILLIVFPILLFYCFVWNRSYEEIRALNTEYYNHSLSTFMTKFTEVVDNFKNHVITFSVNSKSGQEELIAVYYGTPKMQEYAYYYGEASLRLRTYGKEIGYDDLGAYYYDEDVLLINGNKYTADQYLMNVLQINEEDRKLFEEFYSKERYLYNQIIYAPICNAEGKAEKFLLGVCTLLGREREEVILFCQIDYEDMGMSYISSNGRERENYYVLDNAAERILFSVGATQDEYLLVQYALEDGLLQTGSGLQVQNQERYFQKNYSTMDLTFVVDTTGDAVQNGVTSLYKSVKMFFVYIIVIMILIGGIVIYFNYKPVNSLLKEIKADASHEFDAILYSWRDQEKILSEQRMVIMDLLMNQLLYGVPISQKHIDRFGISNEISTYCVWVIKDYVLKVSETEAIIQDVEESFETLLFATDIIGEKLTVLIALMKEDVAEAIGIWIERWIEENVNEKCGINKGQVVYKFNEIHRSFESCIKDKSDDGSLEEHDNLNEKSVLQEVKSRAVINYKLKEKVLDYLEEHFTDSEMSQQKLADYFQVSVYTLSKMFNNQVGMGFSEYLNSKRIEYAKELLRTTEASVKKIAVLVGIPNDNYFSKIFKKYEGCSPIMYREENHK